jgi:hypothetical protein
MSSKKFIKSFSINYNENYKILAENFKPINTKRLKPLVNRKLIKNPTN